MSLTCRCSLLQNTITKQDFKSQHSFPSFSNRLLSELHAQVHLVQKKLATHANVAVPHLPHQWTPQSGWQCWDDLDTFLDSAVPGCSCSYGCWWFSQHRLCQFACVCTSYRWRTNRPPGRGFWDLGHSAGRMQNSGTKQVQEELGQDSKTQTQTQAHTHKHIHKLSLWKEKSEKIKDN